VSGCEVACIDLIFHTLFTLTACFVLPLFDYLVVLAAVVMVVYHLNLVCHCCETIIFSDLGLDLLDTICKVSVDDLILFCARTTGFNPQGFNGRKRYCSFNLQLELLKLFWANIIFIHFIKH
jgi:hypothetical protein